MRQRHLWSVRGCSKFQLLFYVLPVSSLGILGKGARAIVYFIGTGSSDASGEGLRWQSTSSAVALWPRKLLRATEPALCPQFPLLLSHLWTARLWVLRARWYFQRSVRKEGASWRTVGHESSFPYIRVFPATLISGLIMIILPRGYDKGHTFGIYSWV